MSTPKQQAEARLVMGVETQEFFRKLFTIMKLKGMDDSNEIHLRLENLLGDPISFTIKVHPND